MKSIILSTATSYLIPILALFSLFMLLRGHDEPGGGFIGGLTGAMGFALYALADDVSAARRMLRAEERQLIGIGLLLAATAGIWGLVSGEEFLSTYWTPEFYVLAIGKMKLGTPLLFDAGVYLTVVGVVLMIVFTLAEE